MIPDVSRSRPCLPQAEQARCCSPSTWTRARVRSWGIPACPRRHLRWRSRPTGQPRTRSPTLGSRPLGQDLYIMGMTFSPDGILYAAGDYAPTSPTFNSLYTIDLSTGSATRVGAFDVGSTQSEFIMSFAF